MTYEEWRVAAVTTIYKETIEELVRKEYKKGQPTILLLPGGMGSELRRSDRRYQGQSATRTKRSRWIGKSCVTTHPFRKAAGVRAMAPFHPGQIGTPGHRGTTSTIQASRSMRSWPKTGRY